MLHLNQLKQFVAENQNTPLPNINIFVKNANGCFEFANHQMASIAHLLPEHMIGKTDSDLCWHSYASEYKKDDEYCLTHQSSTIKQEHQSNGDGLVFPIFTIKKPIFLDDKRALGVAGFSLMGGQKGPDDLISILKFLHRSLNRSFDFEIEQVVKYFYKKSSAFVLAKRELECCYYLCLGLACHDIGNILNLSSRTVEHYIATVKDKLNLRSRSELICHLLENQIIQADKLPILAALANKAKKK